MIQRVQTIWMILAAIAVFLTLQFPFYSGTILATSAYDIVMATDNFFLMILTSALGTCIVINIFLYKQRSTQIKIVIASLLVEIIIIALYIREINQFSTGTFSLWSGLHLLIILFLFFAVKGIYADSKLIKESDRLR